MLKASALLLPAVLQTHSTAEAEPDKAETEAHKPEMEERNPEMVADMPELEATLDMEAVEPAKEVQAFEAEPATLDRAVSEVSSRMVELQTEDPQAFLLRQHQAAVTMEIPSRPTKLVSNQEAEDSAATIHLPNNSKWLKFQKATRHSEPTIYHRTDINKKFLREAS